MRLQTQNFAERRRPSRRQARRSSGVDGARPAAAPARSRPRTRRRGRRARSASAACRPAARRTPSGAPRAATPARRRARISAAEPSTQSSRVAATISMMVRTPRPSSPSRRAQVPSNSSSDEALDRLPSLSLSRCEPERVARAVRQHPRHHEAGQAARRLGEHEEHVVHRRRGEPLVPVQRVLAVRPAARRAWSCWPGRRSRPASRSSPCRRAARSSSPAAAARGRSACARSRGSHSAASAGSVPQRRHRGVRHRDRAAVAGLDLRPGEEAGRPAHVRAGPPSRPRACACRPWPTARSISQCQDGWNSTSSIRLP